MKKILIALIMATLMLTACSKGDTAGNGENTLKVALGADVASLDPHGKNDVTSERVRANMYETLIYQDENSNLKEGLAKDWFVDDTGKIWTIKLKEGVKFHNGEGFTSEDVKFTIDRGKKSSNVGHVVEIIKEVRVVDDYTVEIELLYPFMPILNNLAHPALGMLDKGTVERQGDDYASGTDGNDPIGTGPFKFESLVKGEGTTLVKNEEYWDSNNKAKVDKLKMLVYTDDSSRKLALEAGDVDIAYEIASSDFESIKKDPNLKYTDNFDFSYTYATFNMNNPKFKDIRVREAINLAIDVESIIQAPTIINGLGKEANAPISMTVFGWSKDIKAYGYNLERAKKLLKEAGEENLKFSIWTTENPTRVQAAVVIQSQLAEVGIEVDIVQMELGAFIDGTANGEHEVCILSWIPSTGDPDNALYPVFHSSKFGVGGNRTFYKNLEVDKLLEAGRLALTTDERVKIYAEVEQLIMDDYIHVPLWYLSKIHGMQKNIEGFVAHPSGIMKLHTVYMK